MNLLQVVKMTHNTWAISYISCPTRAHKTFIINCDALKKSLGSNNMMHFMEMIVTHPYLIAHFDRNLLSALLYEGGLISIYKIIMQT